MLEGKIRPREFTEKEIKEQEEAALAAKVKKAPVKKDKNAPPEPVLTEEELEVIRQAKELEESKERKRLDEWNALDK